VKTAMTRLIDAFSKTLVNDIQRCSLMKQTGVSLKYMMDFGSKPTERNLLLSAQFLHKELPIRLAHRVVELENLPYGLSSKPPVLKVRDWYVESFRDIRYFPEIRDSIDDLNFTEMIGRVKMRHNNVVPTMGMGVQQLKQDLGQKIGLNDLPEIHQFLDGFYMSRIGIRMLIVQERFMGTSKEIPPVKVVVADGIEDVAIKISDEGGGIPRSGLPNIFTYLYSTAESPASEEVSMAGYGYGLPISRLYARYFGGDLQVISMEGYGTDAYLHLSRLGNRQEPLP